MKFFLVAFAALVAIAAGASLDRSGSGSGSGEMDMKTKMDILTKLIPSQKNVCLSEKVKFDVCIGAETEFAVLFEEAVVACSFSHMDEFGSLESALIKDDSASCEFNDFFQHVYGMKTCMLAHFGWIVEGEIQADPIKAFFEEAAAFEYFTGEYDVVDECMARGDLIVDEETVDATVTLILSGELSAELELMVAVEGEAEPEARSGSGSKSGSKSSSSSSSSEEEFYSIDYLVNVEVFLGITRELVVFGCLENRFRDMCYTMVNEVLLESITEAAPAE